MEGLAGILYPMYLTYTYLKALFRAELNTDLLIIIERKQAADMKDEPQMMQLSGERNHACRGW